MKFSADLSLSVPILAGYFTTSFSSNFKNLSAQCDNKSKYGSILGEHCTALDKMVFSFPHEKYIVRTYWHNIAINILETAIGNDSYEIPQHMSCNMRKQIFYHAPS